MADTIPQTSYDTLGGQGTLSLIAGFLRAGLMSGAQIFDYILGRYADATPASAQEAMDLARQSVIAGGLLQNLAGGLRLGPVNVPVDMNVPAGLYRVEYRISYTDPLTRRHKDYVLTYDCDECNRGEVFRDAAAFVDILKRKYQWEGLPPDLRVVITQVTRGAGT